MRRRSPVSWYGTLVVALLVVLTGCARPEEEGVTSPEKDAIHRARVGNDPPLAEPATQ